jgi:hypothetical protein
VIIVFTIVNRAQYTNSIRDRRFWNKRRFPTDTTPINTSLCLDLSSEKGLSLTDMSGNSMVLPSMSMDMSGNKLGAKLENSFNNIMGDMSL